MYQRSEIERIENFLAGMGIVRHNKRLTCDLEGKALLNAMSTIVSAFCGVGNAKVLPIIYEGVESVTGMISRSCLFVS